MGSRGRRDDGPCFFLYELDELDECLRPLSEDKYGVHRCQIDLLACTAKG